MSGISKNIRKITEAWGGKTTGSGIGDAVMDLYNSLPFYEKTEEFVFFELVNPEPVLDDWNHRYTLSVPWEWEREFESGETYHVKTDLFEGDITATGQFAIPHGDNTVSLLATTGTGGNKVIYISTSNDKSFPTYIKVSQITEIVKKLDPKFMTATFYIQHSGNNNYLYLDPEHSKKPTAEMFDTMVDGVSGIILIDEDRGYRPAVLWHKASDLGYGYGECWAYESGSSLSYYCTAEYSQEG